MFQSFFNSLSGLFSFSRSLDTISNNVANMNTPGFRGSDSFFENVGGGLGTRVVGEGLRTAAGEFRLTGNSTDVAIDGSGYFVLRNAENGDLYYTRAGQFQLKDGVLIDGVTGYQVMGLAGTGSLAPIDITGWLTSDAEATTTVNVAGNIFPEAMPDVEETPLVSEAITIYDRNGTAHALKVTLTRRASPLTGFLVEVHDEAGTLLTPADSVLHFDSSGKPIEGDNKFVATLDVDGQPQAITFDFGTGNGMASNGGGFQRVGGTPEDGHMKLPLKSLSFDDKGVLRFVYTQALTESGPQLALAQFADESSLEMLGGRLVSGGVTGHSLLGRPGSGAFGSISGGRLELANVDLTQEFADMIIIQRGYQASSRVMTVSNEMIEQLYNSTRG